MMDQRDHIDQGKFRGPGRSLVELALAGLIFIALAFWCRPFSDLAEFTTKPLVDPAGILQVYPWMDFNAKQIAAGHFPLWNPYTAMGQPHLANLQTAVFFPYWWLWSALGKGPAAYGFLLMGRLWLAAMFWFVFARRKLCGFPGAVVAGAAYAFGGYGLWFVQLIDLNSQMLLPLLLLALPALVLRPGIKTFIASSLLIALAILGGHPEAAFVTLSVAALYTLCALLVSNGDNEWVRIHSRQSRPPVESLQVEREGRSHNGASDVSRDRRFADSPIRRFALLAAALLIGLILSGAAVLPFLNYLSRCWTIHGSGFGFFHLDPRAFFNLILPDVQALFTDMPKEIPVKYISLGPLAMMQLPYHETAVPGNLPGAGLVISGLALYAMSKLRRLPWQAAFFTALLPLLLGLTLGLPLFRLIALIPPFTMNSNFKFFFSEIHVCVAVLAGVGFEAAIKCAKPIGNQKGRLLPAIVMGILGLIQTGIFIFINFKTFRMGSLFDNDSIDVRILFYFSLAYLLILVSLIVLAWILRRGRIAVAITSMLLIFGLSLALNRGYVIPFVNLWGPSPSEENDFMSVIKSDNDPGARIMGLEHYWPANLAMIQGIRDIRSSDALFYRPYIDLLNRINGFNTEQSLGFFYPSYFTRPSPGQLISPEALKLSLGYLISYGQWFPNEIIDQILIKGQGIYGVSPPQRASNSLYMAGSKGKPGIAVQIPCLFLHAPAMASFYPAKLNAGGTNKLMQDKTGQIVVAPHLPNSYDYHPGDGAILQVLVRDGRNYHIAYSHFELPCLYCARGPRYSPLRLDIEPNDRIELSSLPGPLNNLDKDWGWFGELSWYPQGYEPPPEPAWSAGSGGPYLYKIPHLPWAHVEGKGNALQAVRSAGDEVEIELDARMGSSAALTLVVHEAWYPGWRVEVDGKGGRIEIPEDKVSWRVRVPEGARKLTFRFAPDDFRIGLFASLATALVCLIVVIRKKKPQMNADER